jgi:hypothetical protein
LQDLNLSHNQICGKQSILYLAKPNPARSIDLTPLKGIEYLTNLSLSHNSITNLPPTLPILQHLDLSHNQLQNIDRLDEFAYLVTIDLSFNQIKTIQSRHQFLEKLQLRNNQITDISRTGNGLLFLDVVVGDPSIVKMVGYNPDPEVLEWYTEFVEGHTLSHYETNYAPKQNLPKLAFPETVDIILEVMNLLTVMDAKS